LTPAIQPGTDSLTARRSEIRILIADDERAIADTLQLILSRHGFEVVIAYDGKTALEKARARGYEFELLLKPIHPSELLDHLRSLS
jgi:PleD family two-component response regulator